MARVRRNSKKLLGRKRRQTGKRRVMRKRRMSALNANPFKQGTGKSLKMLSTLYGQRSSDNSSPMMVWIYADWCGHCQHFLPTWKSLVASHPEVEFITIDGDSTSFASEAPESYPQVMGFPTIWLFASESEKPVVYRGERSVNGLNNAIRKL